MEKVEAAERCGGEGVDEDVALVCRTGHEPSGIVDVARRGLVEDFEDGLCMGQLGCCISATGFDG